MNKLKNSFLTLGLLTLLLASFTQSVRAESTPVPSVPGSTFDQRLAQRKAERTITLSPTDQTRLVTTCVLSHNRIGVFQSTTVPAIANRNRVYQQIDAKIWVTIGQLKLANKDTFQLEKDRLKFAEKKASFGVIGANLSQTIDDSLVINCAADPVGFKALIETARLYYAQIQTKSTENHDFIVNIIKPQIETFIGDLQIKTPDQASN